MTEYPDPDFTTADKAAFAAEDLPRQIARAKRVVDDYRDKLSHVGDRDEEVRHAP